MWIFSTVQPIPLTGTATMRRRAASRGVDGVQPIPLTGTATFYYVASVTAAYRCSLYPSRGQRLPSALYGTSSRGAV